VHLAHRAAQRRHILAVRSICARSAKKRRLAGSRTASAIYGSQV
jgi:hypothetical protein